MAGGAYLPARGVSTVSAVLAVSAWEVRWPPCIHRLETGPVIVEEQRFCQSN